MTHHDLARRWDHLLIGLDHARRVAVLQALQNSLDTGYPATAEGVQLLVAFSRGQISARQYSARILESLGFQPAPAPSVVPAWSAARREDSLRMPSLQVRPRAAVSHGVTASRPVAAGTYDTLRHHTRQESSHDTVQMYLSGKIPMDEFLRRQQGRAAV